MIDRTTCQAVEQDPEKVSGTCVFRNTRVPVHALFDNIEDGASVSDVGVSSLEKKLKSAKERLRGNKIAQ